MPLKPRYRIRRVDRAVRDGRRGALPRGPGADDEEPYNRLESLPIASDVVIYGTTLIKEPSQAVSEPFGSRFKTQPIPCLDTHGVASTGVAPTQWFRAPAGLTEDREDVAAWRRRQLETTKRRCSRWVIHR